MGKTVWRATVKIEKVSPSPEIRLQPEVLALAGLRDGDPIDVSVTPSGTIILLRKPV